MGKVSLYDVITSVEMDMVLVYRFGWVGVSIYLPICLGEGMVTRGLGWLGKEGESLYGHRYALKEFLMRISQ